MQGARLCPQHAQEYHDAKTSPMPPFHMADWLATRQNTHEADLLRNHQSYLDYCKEHWGLEVVKVYGVEEFRGG